jgi:hypothetical protein
MEKEKRKEGAKRECKRKNKLRWKCLKENKEMKNGGIKNGKEK